MTGTNGRVHFRQPVQQRRTASDIENPVAGFIRVGSLLPKRLLVLSALGENERAVGLSKLDAVDDVAQHAVVVVIVEAIDDDFFFAKVVLPQPLAFQPLEALAMACEKRLALDEIENTTALAIFEVVPRALFDIDLQRAVRTET